MSKPARPMIVTAHVDGGELVIAGDGVELIRTPARSGLWLIIRIAEALARTA